MSHNPDYPTRPEPQSTSADSPPARPIRILITNVHSVRNSGDRVLLQVALDLLRARFGGAHGDGVEITLAMNDPESYPANRPERVVGSFTHWFRPQEARKKGWRVAALCSAPVWLLQAWWAARAFKRPQRSGKPDRLPRDPARRALLLAYGRADIVVSCAGNFLYSSGLLQLPLLLHLLALVYGAWAGKPVYMLPQTLGPFRASWSTWLLGRVLRRVEAVMLRDTLSARLLEAAGIEHPQVVVMPDIAFLYQGRDPGYVEELLAAHGLDRADRPPLLGVSLIDWQAQHGLFRQQARYEAAMAAAVRAFVQAHQGVAILFSQVYGPTAADDDRRPARRVAGQLADLGQRVIQIDAQLSPDQLKAAYGAMDIFLGSRLHANIFALCEQRPVLAIAYQYKTHGIMQMLGLDEWVVDIEEATDARLVAELERLWADRAQVATQVGARVAAVRADVRRAMDLIRTPKLEDAP